MFSHCLKFILSCVILTGCSVGVTHLNSPAKDLDKRHQIEDGRYLKDRTFSLSDIAPVINAYVPLPFPKCDTYALKRHSEKGTLKADLSVSSVERVYELEGEIKCIL